MHKSLGGVIALALVGLSLAGHAATTATQKKSTKSHGKASTSAGTHKTGVSATHKAVASTTSAHTTSNHNSISHTASAKRTKRAPVHSVTRSRQLTPSPDRYREIQQALASKGYLSAEQANGQWSDSSTDALKRFQADQNLDASGKINSLSLIALGLGPKHDTTATPKPPVQ